MAVPIAPPPATGSDPDLLTVLYGYYQAILELQQPQAPTPLWSHATASTLEATAAAADYPEHVCLVLDINSIAVSTKVAGSYAWRRADGTAL
jgi:hypothetical protein